MELPGLNFRPGKVVEAEIRRKFGSLVCHDPSSSLPEFLLVLSFGCCKFHLLEASAALILQAVIGDAASFHVRSLGERVFRFSVSSPAVGFHVHNFHSFECS